MEIATATIYTMSATFFTMLFVFAYFLIFFTALLMVGIVVALPFRAIFKLINHGYGRYH